MKSATHLLLACIPFVVACENAIRLEGTITVPQAVQKRFSSTEPGRVVAFARYAQGGGIQTRVLFVLCDAKPDALVLPFNLTAMGCAEETIVEAFVEPVPPSVGAVVCGPFDGAAADVTGQHKLASDTELAFRGKKGGSCQSGTAKVDLVLKP